MKRPKLTATSYDEASSSDEDDGSSSSSNSSDEEEEVEGSAAAATEQSRRRRDPQKSESNSEDDGSSSSSDEENQDEHPSSSVGPSGEEEEDEENDDDNSGDSSTSTPAEQEADLTLQERLHRNETRGLRTLSQQRERKRTALEIASERLAKFNESKTENTATTFEEEDDEQDGPPSNSATNTKKRKKSKHAPTEVSSKRSDFFRRGPMRLNESGLGIEIGANRYKPLDPRTNSLSGHLNEEQFEKSYEFLQDMRDNEIVQLKKQIGARKETGKKGKRKRRQMNISGGSIEEDESRLLQLKQEKAAFERRMVERAAKRAVKNKIKIEVEEGKQGAYFLKRKEKRKMEFEAKIEELRKRGGHKAVEKAMEKRRKKAKSRDSTMFAK